jgi:hypothetical protein
MAPVIRIDDTLKAADLTNAIARMWEASAPKLRSIEETSPPGAGAPVFTVEGRYTSKGWTEWTQGFQYGSSLLQFDGTGEDWFLEMGRERTRDEMAPHLTHLGVHDHGFNNVSTYGNLRRLALEGRFEAADTEIDFWELALQVSGAVQAARWTETSDGGGFIYSFNGPHSLFADTIRTLRALALAHDLDHFLYTEQDEHVDLLDRLIAHADATARYSLYWGEGRDAHDERGRVAHESIFNPASGIYRNASTQQGYSPFSTWTRGQAWIITGFAELLEWLSLLDSEELNPFGGREHVEGWFTASARAAADHYIANTPSCGVPYWDTGAPGLRAIPDHNTTAADPFNDHEPVDSSAAAIAAQGLLRLGHHLKDHGTTTDADSGTNAATAIISNSAAASRYTQAGLTTARTLLSDPYLSTDPDHQGLLLHAIYHHPNGWDHIPEGSKIPNGEACLWGDYHLRELAVLVERLATDAIYPTFFGPTESSA